jgi:hypothetical protein
VIVDCSGGEGSSSGMLSDVECEASARLCPLAPNREGRVPKYRNCEG